MENLLALHLRQANKGLRPHRRRWTLTDTLAAIFLVGAFSGLWYGLLVLAIQWLFGIDLGPVG